MFSQRESLSAPKFEFPHSSEENWSIFQDHISAASIVFLEVLSKPQLIYIKIHNTVNQMIPHTSEKLNKLISYPLQ